MGGEPRLHLLPGPSVRGRGPAPPAVRLPAEGGGARAEGDGREALGRSRGGLATEVHLLADDGACPLTWLTSPGQRGDSPVLVPVLESLHVRWRGPGRPCRRPDCLRGDKGYSGRDNRAYLRRRGIKAAIAERADQRDKRRRRRRGGVAHRPSAGPGTGVVTRSSGA